MCVIVFLLFAILHNYPRQYSRSVQGAEPPHHQDRDHEHLDQRWQGVENHGVQRERYRPAAALQHATEHAGVAIEVVPRVEGVHVVKRRPAKAAYRRLGHVGEHNVGVLTQERQR
jgi:hypothetical protein